MTDISVDLLDAPIIILDTSAPIHLSVPDGGLSEVTVVQTGPQGPQGPDPWLEPIQHLTGNGPLAIDYALGKHVVLTLEGNTQITVTGWPQAGRIARLTIETLNNGAHQIDAWPAGTKWQNGSMPILTANGEDTVVLTTIDGGATSKGYIAGLNFT